MFKTLITTVKYLFTSPKDLFEAARIGNVKAIRKMVQQGVDVNAVYEAGITALHHAAFTNQIESIKVLKELGADIESKDPFGRTAIFYAAKLGHIDAIIALKDIGANIRATDTYGNNAIDIAAKDDNPEIIVAIYKAELDVAIAPNRATALHIVAQYGKINSISALIQAGADVNAKDNEGKTAFHYATEKGQIDVIKLLKELGADVNAKDNEGKTALHYAAEKGQIDLIKLLKELGADINAKDKWPGKTALALAAEKGQIDLIKLLKELGADVNAKDNEGKTALHYAAANGQIDAIKLLKELGAELNILDRYKKSAIAKAALAGQAAAVIELIDGSNLNVEDDCDNTVLHYAATYTTKEVVEKLIKARADVDAVNQYGKNALHCAAEKGKTEIVALLISTAIYIDQKAVPHKFTALHYAAEKGHTEIMIKLLQRGASDNIKDIRDNTAFDIVAAKVQIDAIVAIVKAGFKFILKDGRTALHYAVDIGNVGAVKEIIQAGVDVNQRDHQGRTALHSAANSGEVEIVKDLIAAGVDVNAKDYEGNDALNHATRAFHGIVEIVTILVEEGGVDVNAIDKSGKPILHSSCEHASEAIVEELIRLGAKPNIRDNVGKTAVHYATPYKSNELLEKIVKAGADINVRDYYEGKTPLILAASNHIKIEKLLKLIELGADVNIEDYEGQIALHKIVEQDEAYPEAVTTLIEAGSHVNKIDRQGKTALDLAVESEYPKFNVIRILLRNKAKYNREKLSKALEKTNIFAPYRSSYSDNIEDKEDALLLCILDLNPEQHQSALGKFKSFVSQEIFEYLKDFIDSDLNLQDRYLKLIEMQQEAIKEKNQEKLEIIDCYIKQLMPGCLVKKLQANPIFKDFSIKDIFPIWENKDNLIQLYKIACKTDKALANILKDYIINQLITGEVFEGIQKKYIERVFNLPLPDEIGEHIFSFLSTADCKTLKCGLSKKRIFDALTSENKNTVTDIITTSTNIVVTEYRATKAYLKEKNIESPSHAII